jgi:streptogramin lyase
MKTKYLLRWGLTLSIAAISLGALLVGLQRDGRALAERNSVALSTPAPQSSFLYRFDSASQTFFTLTLPTGSTPYGVAVTGTNPTHVWVPEYGVNQIGHLIYTDTDDYEWITYSVTSTANSGPFRITINGNDVWFTERGANRVGRLDATTGEITEFYGHGLSPNPGLADIRVAPIGWVWVAAQSSNHLMRLVVTPTTGYDFREYSDLSPNLSMTGISGVAVQSNEHIWYASPNAHQVGRLEVVQGRVIADSSAFPSDGLPTGIVVSSQYAWYSDWQRNSIGQVEIGTFAIGVEYTPTSRPAELAVESPDAPVRLWYAQQDEQGAVGRFTYTSTVSTSFDSFPLPTQGLRPTGIAVAADKGVWLTAFMPVRVFLPVVLKNYTG